MSWQYGLIRDMKNPENWLISSRFGVVMADKYPKAKHHYLVLPLADIPSIFCLDRCHLPLLDELYVLARKVVDVEARGLLWEDFQVGFHAEPSLHRLHLHVISRDFVSPCMKTKKHWNCHNTELFVPYDKLYAQLEKDDCFSRLPKSLVENLLSKPLMCNQCEFAPESLLDLKSHLFYHWHSKEKEREEQRMLDKLAKMSLYNNPTFKNQARKPQGHCPRGPRQRNGPKEPLNSTSLQKNCNAIQEASPNNPNPSIAGDGVRPSSQPTELSIQSTNQPLQQNSNLQHPSSDSNQQNIANSKFHKKNGKNLQKHQSTQKPHANKVNTQFKKHYGYNLQNTKQDAQNPYQHKMSLQNPEQTNCGLCQTNIRSNQVNGTNTNFNNPKTFNHQNKSKRQKPASKKNHIKSVENLSKQESDAPPPPSICKPSDTSKEDLCNGNKN
ncbi:aprataxin-like protein [Drosophila biarmipes]|uniref:aprataxin-like protein n=1 Tax=Drosophila biarmipes TaxID=125945 RepID=UPI0007E67CF1|nr:aprataxin-like protein [Drosophila biarmipes]